MRTVIRLLREGARKYGRMPYQGEEYSPERIEEAIINTSKYVRQVMAYNEQNKFTTALVTLDAAALRADIEGSAVDASDIINIVREDITAFRDHPVYGLIPAQWHPASFAIIPEPFGEDHGLVDSTMKPVRRKVSEHYRYRIEDLYESGIPEPLCEANLQALRELGLIR